ncbi:MAG: 3-deoxy-D-manno-octulosonate 8-phosphate phosphatase [Planctomycetota bacterium]|nr:MAG: 3-deoxy-D-manno-octulosonate 8-phosphate phosphatase [Planctomycetota bacterium]
MPASLPDGAGPLASDPRAAEHPALLARMRAVRLVVTDVDGVLTDGRIIVDDRGVETKHFHVYDGSAVWLLRRAGIETAILSGRYARSVEHRAAELGIAEVHQGAKDKLAVFEQMRRRLGLEPQHCAYLGDDVLDVPLLRHVGLGVAPASARAEARAAAALVLATPGGRGALRELADRLLAAQGKLAPLLRERYGV